MMKHAKRIGIPSKVMDILCASQCTPEATHAEIGRRVGVSRERVRQIRGNIGRDNMVLALSIPKVQLTCLQCGGTYGRHAAQLASHHRSGTSSKFCSKSCKGKYQSPVAHDVPTIEFTCQYCKQPYSLTEAVIRNRKVESKFCSAKCYNAKRRGK